MKNTALIAVIAAIAATVAASGAFAQEATYDYPQPIASTMTRAQVQSELATARADGSIKAWSTTYNPLAMAQSTLTRVAVKAQRRASLASAVLGEDSGSFALSQPSSGRTAPAVVAMGAR